MSIRKSAFALLTVTALVLAFMARPGIAAQTLSIDIFGPGQSKVNIYLAPAMLIQGSQALPPLSAELSREIKRNLDYLPFLSQFPADDLLGGPQLKGVTGESIDFKRFQLSKADLLLSTGWKQATFGGEAVELRLYETFTGRLLVGKAYSDLLPKHIPDVAKQFCGAVMKALTGNGDFFAYKLAFSRKHGKHREIWTASSTGTNLKQITENHGKSLSPAWSRDGRKIVFTHVAKDGHRLGLWSEDDNKVELHDLRGNSVISPVFAPDGTIAVTLDPAGEPDIFLLNSKFEPTKALIKSWAIDVSPSFDASGNKVAFVSSRLGNPHIFVLDVPSGTVERVTYEGKYNTNPSISPDGRFIAFSRQTPEGHRIFMHDLKTGMEQQITFGPGSDESPAFAPDGYFLAFTSSRSGEYRLYLTTRHGDEPRRIETGEGEAKAPAWAVAEK